MAARTHPSRKRVVRLGAVAVAAVLAAEGAVWLLRPRAKPIPAPTVREQDYFSAAELQRASEFRDTQRLLGLAALVVEGGVLVTLALWRPPILRRALRVTSRSRSSAEPPWERESR